MASKKTNYNVVVRDNGFALMKDGAKRATATGTQKEMINLARETLQNLPQGQGGEVRIQGEDGRFREGLTINAKDPFPPQG